MSLLQCDRLPRRRRKAERIVRWEKEGANFGAVIDKNGRQIGLEMDANGKVISKHNETTGAQY